MPYDACGNTKLDGKDIVRLLAVYLGISEERIENMLVGGGSE